MKDESSTWEAGADGLIRTIRDRLDLRAWRVGSDLGRAADPGLDDRKWPLRNADELGCPAEGPRALRARFSLPGVIEGLPVVGESVGVRFLVATEMELHLDGSRVYGHRFWADRRVAVLPLLDAVVPDRPHVLAIRCPSGIGPFAMSLSLSLVDDALFALVCMREQLRLARHLAGPPRAAELRRSLDAALRLLSVERLSRRDWPGIRADIQAAEAALEPFRAPARAVEVHLVGHAHLDMNWLWNYDDTVDTALRDAATVRDLMREHPDLTYSQNQAHILQIVERNRPDLFRDIRRRVKSGRYEVLANTWVEGDLNLVEGESLVRQMLLARDYTRRKFGRVSDVMWEPDTFGHPATMPTLLADAGISSYFFIRCGNGHPVFRWRGPDGGEVIACDSAPSYGAEIRPEILIPRLIRYRERSGLARMLFVHGVGDHGGGPTREDIGRKRAMEEKPVMPSLRFSTARAFFDSLRGVRLPVESRELNPTYEGCYTTHGDIKKANRECQRALLTLEALDAVAVLRGGRSSPRSGPDALWRDALFNQFHDILDGCAIRSSYDYSAKLAADVRRRAATRSERAMNRLSRRGSPRDVTVFNPLGWVRDAQVVSRAPRGVDDGSWVLRGGDGEPVVAACGGGELRFQASGLPPFGFRHYRVAERAAPRPPAIAFRESEFPQPRGWSFETPFLSLVIDPRSGSIKKLRDKVCGRDVIAVSDTWWDPAAWDSDAAGDRFHVGWETPHRMSAWLQGTVYRVDTLLDAQSVRWASEGDRTAITIRQRYRRSRLTRRIVLRPDRPWIDFEVEIDWREKGGPKEGVPVLRTGFRMAMNRPRAHFDIPFGSVERPANAQEYPALKWAALNEGDYWVALLNREKHGYHANGSTLALTLLRNAYDPDPASDTGKQTVSYRLLFGKLDRLKLARAAMEYEMDAVVRSGRRPLTDAPPCEVQGDVLVTSLKPALSGDGLVLRFVEMNGRPQRVRIRFARPPASVRRSNVLEDEGRPLRVHPDGTARLVVRAHSITTLVAKGFFRIAAG
jgi:alpha-mannosidase